MLIWSKIRTVRDMIEKVKVILKFDFKIMGVFGALGLYRRSDVWE